MAGYSTVLTDISAYLVAQLGYVLGTNLFLSWLPDTPVTAIALREYGGPPPEYVHETPGITYELPRVQIEVRAASYAAGRQTAENIYRLLSAVSALTISGTRYVSIRPISPPFPREKDTADHWIFIVNVEARKELGVAV